MKKGQGFARRVTVANLEQFKPLLMTSSSSSATKTGIKEPAGSPSDDPARSAAEALFKGESVRWSIPFKPLGRPSQKPPVEIIEVEVVTPSPATPAAHGPLLWTKRLAASDVQQQTGHPTGGVRLTQARFKVKGKTINQTTYFRHNLFKKFSWSIKKQRPKVEETLVGVNVAILGKSYGVQQLAISDKPSGEAGQGNYTSLLHWGSLGDTVKGLPLVGKTLRLYAPPEGNTEPFFIEIV